MSFAGTYVHTFLIALDQTGAAALLNRNDATISSLCHLQLETDAGNALAFGLSTLTVYLLIIELPSWSVTLTLTKCFWPRFLVGSGVNV